MRDGWDRTTLGEIASLSIGRTPPRKQARYWTKQLHRPFCTIADMTSAHVDPTNEGVTAAAEEEGKAKRVPAGALLLSFKLTIGRVGFAARDLFPNEAIAWVCPEGRVSERFLAVWLSYIDIESEAVRAVKGNTLNSQSLRALPVLVPPEADQRRIVDLIGVVDTYIEGAREVATTGLNLRSALVHELLSGEREIPPSYDRLLEEVKT